MPAVTLTLDLDTSELDSIGPDEVGALVVAKLAADVLPPTIIATMREAAKAQATSMVQDAVKAQLPDLIEEAIGSKFRPMTAWGEPSGPETTLREMAWKYAKDYVEGTVKPNGEEPDRYYGGPRVRRLDYIIRTEVAAATKDTIGALAKEAADAIKPEVRRKITESVAAIVSRVLGVEK